MKTSTLRLFLILLICLPALAHASSEDRVRVQLGWISSLADLVNPNVVVGAEDAPAIKLSLEHYFSERFGLEFGLATSKHDLTTSFSRGVKATAEFRKTPFSIVGNFHGRRQSRVQPFGGLGVAYVTISDAEAPGRTGTFSVDEEWAWLVQGGMDIAVNEKFGLSLAVSYMDIEPGSTSAEVPLESLSVFAGIVFYR